jgi:hypothetical protein
MFAITAFLEVRGFCVLRHILLSAQNLPSEMGRMCPGLLRAHSYFRAGTSPTQASYKRDVFFARRTGSSFLNQGRIENHEPQNT